MPEFDWSIETLQAWGMPLGFVLAGAVVGWLFERVVLARLRRIAKKTDARWDDEVIAALSHAPLLWFTALGIWAATRALPLSGEVRTVFSRGLLVLVVISITLVLARAAAALVTRYARRGRGSAPASTLITNITRFVVFVLGALFVLQALGISITPLVTGLGIGGLAVALALQPTLANTFAGLQIIASGQIRNGDFVRLETGDEGVVTDIKWRNTAIKALWDDHEVVVPNSRLGDSVVINYSLPRRAYWVRIPVGVHYDSDLEHVERVTLEVATEAAEACGCDPTGAEPVVRFQQFGDSSIDLQVRIRADTYQTQFKLRHEFIKRLHARFRDEGIEIPFPIRTLHVPGRVSVDTSGASNGGSGE